MVKKDGLIKVQENAEVICERIRREAQEELGRIRERSSREADEVLRAGAKAAEKKREQKRAELAAELEKERERVFSGVAIEKKRQVLEEKNVFADEVLREVGNIACRFREKPEYRAFLEQAILEGIAVVDAESIRVFYSPNDKAMVTDRDFQARVQAGAAAADGRRAQVEWVEGDFDEIGTVVVSADERIRFDNRFSARLQRQNEKIVTELLKDSW